MAFEQEQKRSDPTNHGQLTPKPSPESLRMLWGYNKKNHGFWVKESASSTDENWRSRKGGKDQKEPLNTHSEDVFPLDLKLGEQEPEAAGCCHVKEAYQRRKSTMTSTDVNVVYKASSTYILGSYHSALLRCHLGLAGLPLSPHLASGVTHSPFPANPYLTTLPSGLHVNVPFLPSPTLQAKLCPPGMCFHRPLALTMVMP
ncbi:uncharacterized protein [Vicugna pacos]|uniref:Uncharacterized protein n=1 Tax=Vicugna pacos TaxID=30538 RepID=A0ABM5CZU1_VICPA